MSVNTVFSYLSNRTHRTKIDECFSERFRIEHSASQGSNLGPLLFNIDLIDLFYECEESNIASYADDATPYSCATQLAHDVVTTLGFSCVLVAKSDNVVTTLCFRRRYYNQKLILLQRCVLDVGFPTWYQFCSNFVILMSFS